MRLTNSETIPEHVPSTSLEARWMNSDETPSETASRERSFEFKSDLSEESSLNASLSKKQNVANIASQRQTTSSKSGGENSRSKQNETSSPESRQIGEGRQGARVEVTSIIANHRKMFPDPAPKRYVYQLIDKSIVVNVLSVIALVSAIGKICLCKSEKQFKNRINEN